MACWARSQSQHQIWPAWPLSTNQKAGFHPKWLNWRKVPVKTWNLSESWTWYTWPKATIISWVKYDRSLGDVFTVVTGNLPRFHWWQYEQLCIACRVPYTNFARFAANDFKGRQVFSGNGSSCSCQHDFHVKTWWPNFRRASLVW